MDRIMYVANAPLLLILLAGSTTAVSKQTCDSDDDGAWKCNYFPKDIPFGISVVKIADFMSVAAEFEINSSYFQSTSWNSVNILQLTDNSESRPTNKRTIYFQANCFSGLNQLQELHLHLLADVQLNNDAFDGLSNITTLDLSYCGRLSLDSSLPAIAGPTKLPALKKLLLSGINYKAGTINIDNSFFKSLEHMQLRYLDISNAAIRYLSICELQRLTKLELFNISFSSMSDGNVDCGDGDLRHIKMLDASYIVPPNLVTPRGIPQIRVFNLNVSFLMQSLFLINVAKQFLSAQIVNVTGIFPKLGKGTSSISLENCTAVVDYVIPWKVQELILRQNNLNRLNINVSSFNHTAHTVRHLDIADNGLEYLHPSLLSFMPNIIGLDLSQNKLFTMYQENFSLFEKLLVPLQQLYSISLSANNLQAIPKEMFEHNVGIKYIDISNNSLDQVRFTLSYAMHLRLLDLSDNAITTLDTTSIRILDSITRRPNKNDAKPRVILKGNPISCSTCESKPFLEWLTKTDLVDLDSGMTCIKENGALTNITLDTIDLVQTICTRRIIIITASISTGIIVLVIFIFLIVLYIQNKRTRKVRNREHVINLLKEGQGRYEFVVFLAYSSNDDDFVQNCVHHQLSEHLKLLTGIERELISTGDHNLRPGFLVLDETVNCLERASVMIVVLSRNYCASNYCHNELDQAFRLNKPILLMFKENVDEDLMMPTMKLLYKQNVRILWTVENGEYILKTTWENVCSSILDLIVNTQTHLQNKQRPPIV